VKSFKRVNPAVTGFFAVLAAVTLFCLISLTGSASAYKAVHCRGVVQPNYYRVHMDVRGVPCRTALRLYSAYRNSDPSTLPYDAMPPRYLIWGAGFGFKGFNCHRMNVGLAGSEYDLRCLKDRGRRVVAIKRRQDGS